MTTLSGLYPHGTTLQDIMEDIPTEPAPRWPRRMPKDIRPAVILGLVLVYSVTVIIGATTVVILNINGNDVAQSCIETGGEWVITDDGGRQCIRDAPTSSSSSSR